MKKSALDTLGGRLLLGGTSGQAAGGRVPSKLRIQARGHRKVPRWGWCCGQKAQYVHLLRDRKELSVWRWDKEWWMMAREGAGWW